MVSRLSWVREVASVLPPWLCPCCPPLSEEPGAQAGKVPRSTVLPLLVGPLHGRKTNAERAGKSGLNWSEGMSPRQPLG